MKEHSIVPLQGLPLAEKAVKYILDILPLYPELAYYMDGTTMLNLLCEAEASRLGIEPDPTYQSGFHASRFEEDYCRNLRPKEPKPCYTCPECGYEGEEDI